MSGPAGLPSRSPSGTMAALPCIGQLLLASIPDALLAAVALLAAGCRARRPWRRRSPAPRRRRSGPRRGGTVVTGWTAEPGGVNELIIPSSQPTNEMLFRIFLHLVEEQSDFEEHPPTFTPQLAESYDWSADHKTLTFHLRDDAVWSDGVPVTAEDVRWTWQAQSHPDVAWDNADAKRWITDVEVVDPAHRALPLLPRLRQAAPRRQRGGGPAQARLGEDPLPRMAPERRLVQAAPGGGRPVHHRLVGAAAAARAAAQRALLRQGAAPASTGW